MTAKQLCISADSHVVESAEFFKPLAKRFANGLKNSADSTTWESAEMHSCFAVMAFSF